MDESLIAVVGTGPSAKQPQGYDYIVGVNETPFFVDTRVVIDERAIEKVAKILPRSEDLVLSLLAFNTIPDLTPEAQSLFYEHRIAVRRTSRFPKFPGHLYASPSGVISSALSWLSRENPIGDYEVELIGFDFHDPAKSERRNKLLAGMKETLHLEIEAELYHPLSIRWKHE